MKSKDALAVEDQPGDPLPPAPTGDPKTAESSQGALPPADSAACADSEYHKDPGRKSKDDQ